MGGPKYKEINKFFRKLFSDMIQDCYNNIIITGLLVDIYCQLQKNRLYLVSCHQEVTWDVTGGTATVLLQVTWAWGWQCHERRQGDPSCPEPCHPGTPYWTSGWRTPGTRRWRRRRRWRMMTWRPGGKVRATVSLVSVYITTYIIIVDVPLAAWMNIPKSLRKTTAWTASS